jgi:hypothetical protein
VRGVIPGQRPCLQVPIDELEDPSVRDPRLDPAHQLVMIHPVKELLQIQVHHPAIPRLQVVLGLSNRLVR